MTAYYAILHLFVDGICALAMFGAFIPREDGYFSILLYNFCAFALQMPFGVILDALYLAAGKRQGDGRKRGWKWQEADIAFLTAAAGVACTIAGAVSHPIVLGVGNALFHVGGGVGTIREDFSKGWKGKGLGVFVAPGAFGLYLGTLAGKNGLWREYFWAAGILAALLCLGMAGRGSCLLMAASRKAGKKEGGFGMAASRKAGKKRGCFGIIASREAGRKEGRFGMDAPKSGAGSKGKYFSVTACCFAVVVLRSYLGMSVTFPWKAGAAAGMCSVLALVFGKMAGGFWAAGERSGKAAAASLGLAALCYLFSDVMPIGLAALFFFNMTMPITLYWMACCYPKMPGLAFGLLTFALFLEFLPGYFGILPEIAGNVLGCAGSLVSLAFLLVIVIGKGIGRE